MESIEKIKAKSKDEQLEMARSPETSEEDLVTLAQVGNHRVRKALASRKEVSTDTLLSFIKNNYLKLIISERKDLPDKVLHKLVEEDNWVIREKVASHPGLSEDIIIDLANDESDYVRSSLLENQKFDAAFLSKMVKIDKRLVRKTFAASNPLPPEVAKGFVDDDYYGTKVALAKNPSVGSDIHEALLKDKQAVVRKAVCQAPTLKPEITKIIGDDENDGVIEEIFKREDLTEKDLEILCSATNWRARALVSKHPNVTEEQLLKLAKDEEKRVKLQLAKRATIPGKVILELVFGEEQGNNIKKLVLKKDLDSESLIELSKKGNDYVKKVISKREDLPDEAKAILSEDPNETVRSNLKAS